MFAFSACRLDGRVSTKSALRAPRDIASSPSAPVPAKRSSTRAPFTSEASWSSSHDRTPSAEGRTRKSFGEVRSRPLNLPPTILKAPSQIGEPRTLVRCLQCRVPPAREVKYHDDDRPDEIEQRQTPLVSRGIPMESA